MKQLLYLLALVVVFSSCERVIDINLNAVQKKYVIEGNITNITGNTTTVLLTQTKNFDEDNDFVGVSGAAITITDDNNTPVPLTESSAGVYTTTAINGRSGHTYTLKVSIGTQVFTATSRMPSKVNLDDIFVTDETLFGDTKKMANVVYVDPAGKGNAYRFIQFLNGRKEKSLFVRDDDLTDGKVINRTLFYFNDNDDERRDIKKGDALKIEMQCIDYPMYKYWYSLDAAATGSNQQATPANPVNNIQGGALGYFSAHTTQTKDIVVP
jgi:hypothetical protein